MVSIISFTVNCSSMTNFGRNLQLIAGKLTMLMWEIGGRFGYDGSHLASTVWYLSLSFRPHWEEYSWRHFLIILISRVCMKRSCLEIDFYLILVPSNPTWNMKRSTSSTFELAASDRSHHNLLRMRHSIVIVNY